MKLQFLQSYLSYKFVLDLDIILFCEIKLNFKFVFSDEPHSERGETVYWDKRMKKRKRRRTQINASKTSKALLIGI